MSKLRLGILDGYRGKIGNTVGFFWKGKAVNRGYNDRPANPRTAPQQLVRAKFATLGILCRSILPVVKLGMKATARAKKWTESNVFMKKNYANVTGSTPESLIINYEALQVADGSLPNVQYGTPDFSTAGEVTVPIEDPNYIEGLNDNEDTPMVVAYCPDMHGFALSGGDEVRTDETITVAVPRTWAGMKVYVYGWTKAKDSDEVSMSTFIGFGNVS